MKTQLFGAAITALAILAVSGAVADVERKGTPAQMVVRAAKESKLKPGTPCTVFVEDTLRRAGYKFSEWDQAVLQINLRKIEKLGELKLLEPNGLKYLVDHNNPYTKGVVLAMTQSGQGREVRADELKPGDVVQFWNQSASGHTAIVVEVTSPGVVMMYGSHSYSNPEKANVGPKEFDLNGKHKVYAVRPE